MGANAIYLIGALLLVAVNAFFVATEFAIVRVRATRIEELVSKGVRRAAATRDVLKNLDAYISACQLGITMTSLGLGWIGEPAFARLFEPAFAWAGRLSAGATHTAAIAMSFALITFLHVVFGELAPKALALAHPERTSLIISWPIRAFRLVFHPLIELMNGVANVAIRVSGIPPASETDLAHSEAELRMILSVSRKTGALSEAHARLLENALDFPDRAVRQIMVPRGDIVYLDLEDSYAENLVRARDGGHTRYPLCEGNIDSVVGVIHIKDLFRRPEPSGKAGDLRSGARKPLFIPESVSLQRVLAQFQRNRIHIAIVIDEYGGTSGIVTLEDVLEELIGEIQDEFDHEAPAIQPQPDGRLLVEAGLPLDESETQLGIQAGSETEVDSLGGLVLARLGRIARVGDVILVDGRRIEVARVRGRRIVSLLVDPPLPPRDPATPS